MDTSTPASDSLPTKDSTAKGTGTTGLSRPRRSRVTSQALAELWATPGAAEAVALPKNLKPLGEALRRALESGGALGKAYVALADEAMLHPATFPAFADFVIRLFASEPMALLNLVRTQDLIAELENGGSELTRTIALRWEAGSMGQKISRFGESLISYKERLRNPVAAEVMAAFAGLLALSKPSRAASIFQLATEISSQPGDADFVEDVRVWLSAGELINPMSPEDRAFWQECLRHANDTDWSGAEAGRALSALASRLKASMPCAGLFEHTVPAAWWEKHMAKQESPPAAAKPEPEPAAVAVLAQSVKAEEPAPGKEDPPAVTAASPGLKTEKRSKTKTEVSTPKEEPVSAPAKLERESVPVPAKEEPNPPKAGPTFVKMESAPVKNEPASEKVSKPAPMAALSKPVVPPRAGPMAKPASAAPTVVVPSSSIRPFLFGQVLGMALVAGVWIIQPDLLPRALGVAGGHWLGGKPQAAAVATASPPSASPVTASSAPPSAASSPVVSDSIPGDKWRIQQAAELYAHRPAMRLWVSKVQEATWQECAMLVEGRYPVAYPTVEDYQLFLKWLMLDPPHNEVVRRAVPKLYVRASSVPDFIDLCEHLSYPGSVTRPEIPFIAQLAIDMHTSGLTNDQRSRLKKLAAMQ